MLNYLWMGLLILGIGVALVTDVSDQINNTYRNGDPLTAKIEFQDNFNSSVSGTYNAEIKIPMAEFNSFYGSKIKTDIDQKVRVTVDTEKGKNLLFFKIGDSAPKVWKEIADAEGKPDDITGTVTFSKMTGNTATAEMVLESVSFTKMKAVTNGALDIANTAVKIAFGLIGIMALWLGIMKIAEDAGLIKLIAKAVRPITGFLFPDIPHDHPAMGSMIMNISANMLGLGNAATPFGLKAMDELQELNPNKDVATNTMCTFLAVNTAGLTLIPATAIAIRSAMGSSNPTIIIGTSIFGAMCATTVGITAAKIFEKFSDPNIKGMDYLKSKWKVFAGILGAIVLVIILSFLGVFKSIGSVMPSIDVDVIKSVITAIATLAIPLIIFIFVLFGFIKKVKVYEAFVEGAKEGFNIAVKIIPYLVGMLVAIAVFRAGGMMQVLESILAYPASWIGMPPEVIPMALIRPLSGSGSTGVMTEIMAVHGPDSYIGIMASTFFGSTETTFYVLAVYFGAVNIKKTRHALPVGLLADIAGILGAVFIVKLLFG